MYLSSPEKAYVRTPVIRRSRCIFFICLGIAILVYGNGMVFLGLFGVPAEAVPLAEQPLIRMDQPGDGLLALQLVQYEFSSDDDDSVTGRGLRLQHGIVKPKGELAVRYLSFLPQFSRPSTGLVPAGLLLVLVGALATVSGSVKWHRLRMSARRLPVTIADGILVPVHGNGRRG